MRKILLLLITFLFITTTLYAANFHQGFFLTTMDEEEVEGVLEKFPRLGERVRDWVVIAREAGQIVVHIIIQHDQVVIDRLKARPEYLGKSYKQIAQKAKAGNTTCRAVLKRIVFTNWEIDNPDYPEGPARITYRGSLGEWIAAGRPAKLSGWYPAHVWLGQTIEVDQNNE